MHRHLLALTVLCACTTANDTGDGTDETCAVGDAIRGSCQGAADGGSYTCTEFVGTTWREDFLADTSVSCAQGQGTWSDGACANHGSAIGGCFLGCQVQWYTDDELGAADVQALCEAGGGVFVSGS